MRNILVPVADRPECVKALQSAFKLARQLDASVTGCHIRAHTDSSTSITTSPKQSAAAKSLFAAMAEKHGYAMSKRPKLTATALWMEKVGSPGRVLEIMGPLADLIIVTRPAKKGGKLARLFMDGALLGTSRPVLVLPRKKPASIGKRICIAWNQSTEASSAVAAAMPMLQYADQVSIITHGEESGPGPKAKQLATYLKFWGVEAKLVRASGRDECKGVITAFKKEQADLLIMGAYSRSRLRQQIFGGFTEYMLRDASIPVLMLHPH